MAESDLIEVRPLQGKSEQEAFLHIPWTLGMDRESQWVPPLLDDQRRMLDPKKSPFLQHGEVQCFMAYDRGQPVGRISAQIDRDFDKIWPARDPKEADVAFFGFFDAPDRPEVARALLKSAETWARGRGRKRLRGPFTLDSKGDVGVLVDGFDTPPRIGTPYNRPYLGKLIEDSGFPKRKDYYGWWYIPGSPIDPFTHKVAERTRALPNVRIRTLDLSQFEREVDIIRDIYNEAWGQNWNYTPFTREEIDIIASEYKMFVDPQMGVVAEVDGKPAAICFAVPDVNELVKDFKGELMKRPLNLVKLLYRLKFDRPKAARLILLGVKEEFRASRKYGALAAVLYEEIAKHSAARGYLGGELSWTLEDNDLINRGIERMGAKKYKTWRVYEKELV
jgi:GNAT superfamily N-acetyltransferase